MAETFVQSYTVRWSARDHRGSVSLRVFGATPHNPFRENIYTIQVEDPDEFRVLLDLLRYEKPLKYSTTSKTLYTSSSEPVGEEET